MLTVIFYFCCVGLMVTLSLLGPVFVGLLTGETDIAWRFGFYLVLGVFLFGTPVLATLGRLTALPRVGRLILMFLVWTLLPLMAAVPIYDMTDSGFVNSLFEAVSGLTTTGSTTLKTTEQWPSAMIFWRVQLQWLGGFLALLTVILILAPMGIGGLTSRRDAITVGADLSESDNRLLVFTVNLALIYATITGLCFLCFFLTGTRAFYAATLAMTATSTSGFLPFDKSLDEVLGVFGLFVFGLFLLLGATSIFFQRMLMSGRFVSPRQHRESIWVIGLGLILTLVFVYAAISVSSGSSFVQTLSEGFLNSASLVSTSGVQSRPGYFTLIPLELALFVVFVGGSAFSTSGGLKQFRQGGMVAQSWGELDRLIYPDYVRQSHFDSRRFEPGLMKSIWSFFFAAILLIAIGTIVIAGTGIPFEAALTASLATFSTAGPMYSAGWAAQGTEAWPAYTDFSPAAKSTLMVIMVLGRLEILAVVSLFSSRYWRTR